MAESDKGRRSTKLDELDDFPIEREILGDVPQLDTESHMEVDRCALDIRESSSEAVKEEARECYESEQIPHQKVEQCEETMQNVSVEISGAEYEGVVDECRKELAVECAGKSDDGPSEERSGALNIKEACIVEQIGVILENVMDNVSAGSTRRSLGDEEIAACKVNEQDVPEMELGLERVEQPEQELLVQQARQVVELIPEEAVICDARRQMEVARDIEEPQKYAFREKENVDYD